MLLVTIQLIPGGYGQPRNIALMTIENVSDLADRSNYRVEASEVQNNLAGLPQRSVRTAVTNHYRRQSVWTLIAKAAAAASAKGHEL